MEKFRNREVSKPKCHTLILGPSKHVFFTWSQFFRFFLSDPFPKGIEDGWKFNLKPDNGLLSSNSGQGSRNRVVVIPVFMSKVTDLVNL